MSDGPGRTERRRRDTQFMIRKGMIRGRSSCQSSVTDLERELDTLFQAPFAEFVGARNGLAARLKKEGRDDESARVRGLAKPSFTAWLVNQLYWSARRDPRRLSEGRRSGAGRRKGHAGRAKGRRPGRRRVRAPADARSARREGRGPCGGGGHAAEPGADRAAAHDAGRHRRVRRRRGSARPRPSAGGSRSAGLRGARQPWRWSGLDGREAGRSGRAAPTSPGALRRRIRSWQRREAASAMPRPRPPGRRTQRRPRPTPNGGRGPRPIRHARGWLRPNARSNRHRPRPKLRRRRSRPVRQKRVPRPPPPPPR